MARQTKAQKIADQRIERAYRLNCSGVQIDVMDIGKIFAEGHKAIAEGVDDATLGQRVRAFVDTIRTN